MRSRVRFLLFTSAYALFALALSYIEALLPVSALIPIPGFKLGMANIVIAHLLYTDKLQAFTVSLLKVALTALLFGTPTTFVYSFAGAVLSYFAMLAVFVSLGNKISGAGLCAVGGMFHNAGQLIVTSAMLGVNTALAYATPMLFSGIICGIALGAVLNLISERIRATLAHIYS